ncbi:MAG TPA: carbohydrate kinase family protein [Anaerovoracaceae bacterium]|nr:carbohydrate kinase family protein [Anaerovoracaceae bacterium]
MEKLYDIVTALDICADIIVTGRDVRPEFGQKEKNVGDYFLEMGGSTCIFACQAAKLGLKTIGVGTAGKDVFGELVLKTLTDSGVDTSCVETDSSKKTAVSIHLSEGEDRAILTYPGTIDVEGLGKRILPIVEKARHIHIGSYYLMEKLMPDYPKIIQCAKRAGTTISLDTNWDPQEKWDRGLEEILPYVDVFFPNINEVTGISGESDCDKAAGRLSRDVGILVLKKGSEGAALYEKGKAVMVQSPIKVDVIDAVGAGDSFDAGFLYGYLNGLDRHKCLAVANLCGAWNTLRVGGTAGQVRIDELDHLLKNTF